MKAIVGKKIGMTQVFTEDGKKHAVTVLDVSDVVVSKHLKNQDSITHVEIGMGRRRKPTKADQGNYKQLSYVPQFKVVLKAKENDEAPEVGTIIGANVFEIGEKVDVSGVTKGKGFQGVMKRWGFHGGPKTHGGPTGKMRAGGSIGSGTTPGNVVKGKKMPGHMGNANKTIQNLKIVQVDEENSLIAVAGAIPGANGSYLVVTKAIKSKQ